MRERNFLLLSPGETCSQGLMALPDVRNLVWISTTVGVSSTAGLGKRGLVRLRDGSSHKERVRGAALGRDLRRFRVPTRARSD